MYKSGHYDGVCQIFEYFISYHIFAIGYLCINLHIIMVNAQCINSPFKLISRSYVWICVHESVHDV